MKVLREFLVSGLVTALVLASAPALAAGAAGQAVGPAPGQTAGPASGVAPGPVAVGYEAEDGVLSQAVVEANHAGYTGTGFVNYDNWTETSCSSMYTFTVSRAVRRGYVDAAYQPVADKGYRGVLAKVGPGPDGLTDVADISVGTNVGDLPYYLGRTRATNDLHGLGAFLIMNEQLGPVG